MLVFFSLSWEFYWMLLLRYFTRWSTPEKPERIFLWKNPSWQRTRFALAGKPIFYTAKVYRKTSQYFRVEKMAMFTVFNLFLFMIKVNFSHSKFFSDDFTNSSSLTTHRTAGEGRGPSFIALYHFHQLTNIQTFICNFACEMNITYF